MLTTCQQCAMPLLGNGTRLVHSLHDAAHGREFILMQGQRVAHACRLDEPRYIAAAMRDPVFAGECRSLFESLERLPTLTATALLIADRVAPLLGADYANLAIVDDNQLRIIHRDSLNPSIAAKYESVPIDRSTPLGMASLTCEPVVLPSLASYEA